MAMAEDSDSNPSVYSEEYEGDLPLSFESSSFEEPDEDLQNFGVLPYQFEPYASDTEEDTSDNSDDHHAEELQARVGNSEWCRCGYCGPMPTSEESVCCMELPKVEEVMREVHVNCITTHPGFQPACLDPYVLRIAYYSYRQLYGEDLGETPERQRYIAYRQLVRWCWGYLGRNVRVPLPACAVLKIRKVFPDPNGQYKGFQD